jgi:hypothetical protein
MHHTPVGCTDYRLAGPASVGQDDDLDGRLIGWGKTRLLLLRLPESASKNVARKAAGALHLIIVCKFSRLIYKRAGLAGVLSGAACAPLFVGARRLLIEAVSAGVPAVCLPRERRRHSSEALQQMASSICAPPADSAAISQQTESVCRAICPPSTSLASEPNKSEG